jgi:microcystin-dependent protein
MSDSYLAEIRCFPYNRIPTSWHLCDGSILQVKQNAALFSLIGNYYGGDGKTTFALPDLRGRVPMQVNPADPSCAVVGSAGGAESVTLTPAQMPAHMHGVTAVNTNATATNPTGNLPATVLPQGTPAVAPFIYAPTPAVSNTTALAPGALQSSGNGQAHENRQPTMAMNWCICISGYYPPRN